MYYKTYIEKQKTHCARAALIACAADAIYLDLMGRKLNAKQIIKRHKDFSKLVCQLAMKKLRKEKRIMTVQVGYLDFKMWYEINPLTAKAIGENYVQQ